MRIKSLTQLTDLQTGVDYLAQAAQKLRESGEPGLAMAVLAIRRKADIARVESEVRASYEATYQTTK
jgi:hypothetical protein